MQGIEKILGYQQGPIYHFANAPELSAKRFHEPTKIQENFEKL